MNKKILYILWPVILVCVLPAVLLINTKYKTSAENSGINLSSGTTQTTVIQTTVQTTTEVESASISVQLSATEVVEMSIEDYVLGVVLAEMPHWFETEALKAQAVVARTYTLRRSDGNGKHTVADVCSDPSCCQGYCDENAYLASGATIENLNKIKQAVHDTRNMVLIYDGELIEATYFSCSGGVTEDAAAVWGADVPYLQSTDSPGEEDAACYSDSKHFSSLEFQQILGRSIPGNVNGWFGDITYTEGNGVATIEIGGQVYHGTDLRRILGLRSTAFTVSTLGNTILFTTKGYGHRVGMSQYGADAMAAAGNTYEQILLHYYAGTELVSYIR